MTDRPEMSDGLAAKPSDAPSWNTSFRLSKEQLAAAERTREYHVRKLQQQVSAAEFPSPEEVRTEH
ncbi:hypothetical protein [Piscinibacter terrae]|uniref:hypothetical protein n=1 Tax=Piscinibacter terrae TaxID=2496871 RepID=UPI001386B7D3|nr:hypothetical protein [Albitalea terrae]